MLKLKFLNLKKKRIRRKKRENKLNENKNIENELNENKKIENELNENKKIEINLFYDCLKKKKKNFGDDLSKFITNQLINHDKYKIIYNEKNKILNLICIGSYIHKAINETYIFGSGLRTYKNIENEHLYTNLNVYVTRGPLTKKFLEEKNIKVPEIYGDPALLLSLFYKPKIDLNLKDKIGLIPHKTNLKYYKKKIKKKIIDKNKFYIISPLECWENVINKLCSCKFIISSSLHGLICSDAYNIPNIWLDEYKLEEGDFKFRDYFESQGRKYIKIESLHKLDENLLYKDGNKIDLELLKNAFPFK